MQGRGASLTFDVLVAGASPSPGVGEGGKAGFHQAEADPRLVSLLAPLSIEAEQYRGVSHRLERLHETASLSVVAVSSPAEGDGRTTTAINLAGALAQIGDTRVLLMEADFHRPAIADRLGVGGRAPRGLGDLILEPSLRLDDVAMVAGHGLSVITAGAVRCAPYELVKSPRLAAVVGEARRSYDYVIVDTPPLVGVSDCRLLARIVDGFVVVVAAHRTPRSLVLEALATVEPIKMIGVVFNGDDGSRVSRGVKR